MFGHDDGQQQSTNQWQQPGDQSQIVQPADDSVNAQDASSTTATTDAPVVEETAQADTAEPAPATPIVDEPAPESTAPAQDLIDIKQQALQQLSPLIGHLEQNPEEKFKTTMMMIQASDDQTLVPAAYKAAQAITDEKVKAQALLDIVNEINYFTQKG